MADDVKVDSVGKSNESESVSRFKLGPVGYNGLRQVNGHIYEESKVELRWPYAAATYKKMSLDPTIASVKNFIKIMLTKVEWYVEYSDDSSDDVVKASEYLSFCKDNMDNMSWREFISESVEAVFNGFQVNEKVFTKVNSGEYTGKIKWKTLPSRPADTLTGWVFDEKTHDLLGVKQNPSMIGVNSERGEVTIPRNKFMHFVVNGVAGNPEGTAALKGCYVPWKQKTLAEDLELVGMTKDLAGIVDIGVDAEYLSKAAQDPNGPEAQNIEQMKKDAANLSAGEQSYVITPIAYTESGKPLFHFKLTGVDGGGKQYDTSKVILRKQNEIFTVFLADVLKLGQDGSGSYALSDNKNNVLALSLEYYLNIIADVINRDLVPQTLALNGWKFKASEMPKFTFGDIDQRDLDEMGKFIQRAGSVGFISKDKDLDAELRRLAGLPKPDYDNPMPETDKGTSRAGDGMAKGSGNGTSDSAGGDNSTSNNENASVPEGFVKVNIRGHDYLMMEEDAEEFNENT